MAANEQPLMEAAVIRLEERQIADIGMALWYVRNHNIGASGHNTFVLTAQLAKAHGFRLDTDNKTVVFLRGQSTQLSLPKSVRIMGGEAAERLRDD